MSFGNIYCFQVFLNHYNIYAQYIITTNRVQACYNNKRN